VEEEEAPKKPPKPKLTPRSKALKAGQLKNLTKFQQDSRDTEKIKRFLLSTAYGNKQKDPQR